MNSFWIAASVADVAVVDPNGIKTLLANVFSTFFIKGKTFFSNDPKILPKSLCGCPILYNWVFDRFILADELSDRFILVDELSKTLQSLETCVVVNNNLCEKLFHH